MRSSDTVFRSVLEMAVIVLLTLGVLSGCDRGEETTGLITESPDGYSTFPEFFLEKGVDADSSYIALQGLRKSGGILELQATSWGIRETGLFLARQKASKAAVYVFMGECGTVSSRTWEKVTLHQELTVVDQDTINRILFTSHGDTLEVVRTHIYTLLRLAYVPFITARGIHTWSWDFPGGTYPEVFNCPHLQGSPIRVPTCGSTGHSGMRES